MPMASRTAFFSEFDLRVKRATGSAIIGMAEAVAVETKRVTHVFTGNLRRSVHAAPVGYGDEENDIRDAERGDLLAQHMFTEPTPHIEGWAVEVGSWMPYACVEWVGRQHPGITQGLEAVAGLRATGILAAAFRREGL